MASIWEKAISILAENLNSGRSYLITAVLTKECFLFLQQFVSSTHAVAIFTITILCLSGSIAHRMIGK